MISVVVGGHGAVGSLFCRLLAAHGPTTSVDRTRRVEGSAPEVTAHVIADICAPNAALKEQIGQADVVVLAIPESILESAVTAVAPLMSRDALLVHTASVQTAISELLVTEATRHWLQACGVDPMFAPALGFPGRPVALTAIRPGPRIDALAQFMSEAGARVVPITPDEHDRLTAGIQVATHASVLAFGLSICRSGVDVSHCLELATPPYRAMLTLCARLCSGEPEVYREIQDVHPLAEQTRVRVRDCVQELSARSADSEDFAAMIAEMSGWLGNQRELLAADCARWFSSAPPTTAAI